MCFCFNYLFIPNIRTTGMQINGNDQNMKYFTDSPPDGITIAHIFYRNVQIMGSNGHPIIPTKERDVELKGCWNIGNPICPTKSEM